MKKIGIVTITGGANYGNRLQNYAMQRILEKNGYKTYTIRKQTEKDTFKKSVKRIIKKYTRLKNTPLNKRIEKFKTFDKTYIKYSRLYIKSDEYDNQIESVYDGFVCGSDQIWNPNYKMNTGSNYLSFIKNKKKISVAASFGVDRINKENMKDIKNYLKGLDSISVREKSGQLICKELLNKDVEVLIDPTLTLDEKEWKNIEKEPKNIPQKKFIFCYLLGNHRSSFFNDLREYARKSDKELVFLEDIWRKLKVSSDAEYSYGPSEFVWLIDNCEEVVTDSYHACIFSMIFNKKFLIVPRNDEKNDMSSRFFTLTKKFEIEDITFDEVFDEKNYIKVEKEKYNEIIEKEKKRFIGYIQKNLNE